MELLDGRYQIKKVLGRGGFGTTFLAEDKRSSNYRLCVVKQLQPIFSELYLLTKAKTLFKREAETLGILGKHPNIPRLFAYFEENSEFYIVQEYIAGHTLEEELKPNQPLSEQQVIDIVKQLLEILSFVHRYNVIHRDIKPTNIIRRKQNNKLVLIDFGSVKKVTKAKEKKGTIVGSYSYISEEQFNGKPNFCSDLYAVGIIGIQAITGIELKQMIGAGFPLTEEGEISWQKYAKVSDNLAYFLSKMVRHNYRYRYQSATEALQALQEVVETNKIIANNSSKRSKKLSSFPTKMLIVSTILVGLMSTVLIAYNILNRSQTFRELSLNGKSTESYLNQEDICQDFSDSFYCEKYSFSGKKGQKIIIEMFSQDFDPYLVLLKNDTSELAVGDNMSLFNWNAQIIINLPEDGNYIVVARNSEIGASGIYTIRAIKKILE